MLKIISVINKFLIRLFYLVHLCHYLIVEISVAIFVINSSIFLNKFFTDLTFLISVNNNPNSVKSLESPATSSHTIYNQSFNNIVYKIHKIIEINSAISVGLPERLLRILTNPNPGSG